MHCFQWKFIMFCCQSLFAIDSDILYLESILPGLVFCCCHKQGHNLRGNETRIMSHGYIPIVNSLDMNIHVMGSRFVISANLY